MKRYIVGLLVAVLSVPLFTVSAWAADLDLRKVIADERLPPGYISQNIPRVFQNKTNELVFFDHLYQTYFYIGFNGACQFVDFYSRYIVKFDDYASVEVRQYSCDGRDVFALTPEQQFNITIPAGKLADINYDGYSYTEYSNGTFRFSSDYYHDTSGLLGGQLTGKIGSDVVSIQQGYYLYFKLRESHSTGSESSENYVRIPSHHASVMLQQLNIQVTIDEFAQTNFDYYVVQKNGSGVSTPIDSQLKWYSNSISLCFYNSVNNSYTNMYGVPVAMFIDNVADASFSYPSGSYYLGSSRLKNLVLKNSDKLVSTGVNILYLSQLNKYLNHFGFDSVFYSADNAALSNEINNVGNQMGNWSSQARDFSGQSSLAIIPVRNALKSYDGVFLLIWNMLPSWVNWMLMISLVIVIGRKILGR